MNLNILFNSQTGRYFLDEIDFHFVTNTKDLLRFGKQGSSRKQAMLFGRPKYLIDSLEHLNLAKEFTNSYYLTRSGDKEIQVRKRANYNDLPGTEKEINSIDSMLNKKDWNSHVYLGKEALEEAVKTVDNPGISYCQPWLFPAK